MLRYATVFILSLLLAGPALAAQDQADPPEGRGNRAAAPGNAPFGPGEVAVMLDTYALVQAQEALALNDEQYASFVTRLKKLQHTRRRNQQARNQIVRELARLTAPPGARPNVTPGDEATISARLKALREHDERAAVELRQAYDALDQVLSVHQQARFRVFEERLELRKLDLLMRARQAAARGRGR